MTKITLTPKAKIDLSNIWDYSLSEWGVNQAEKYVRELWAAIQAQTKDLSTSIDCTHIRPGYRKLHYESHLVFFKVQANSLNVIRILHQRMDFSRHL